MLLTLKQLLERFVPVSEEKWKEWVEKGIAPRPIRIEDEEFWVEEEVRRWVRKLQRRRERDQSSDRRLLEVLRALDHFGRPATRKELEKVTGYSSSMVYRRLREAVDLGLAEVLGRHTYHEPHRFRLTEKGEEFLLLKLSEIV